MGIMYNINAYLQAQYNEKTIKKIFDRSVENSFKLYKEIFEPGKPNILIDAEEAASIAIHGYETNQEIKFSVLCSFNKIFIALYFYSKGNLKVDLVPVYEINKKDFIDGHFGIDLTSYINIILAICKDFKIIKMDYYTF